MKGLVKCFSVQWLSSFLVALEFGSPLFESDFFPPRIVPKANHQDITPKMCPNLLYCIIWRNTWNTSGGIFTTLTSTEVTGQNKHYNSQLIIKLRFKIEFVDLSDVILLITVICSAPSSQVVAYRRPVIVPRPLSAGLWLKDMFFRFEVGGRWGVTITCYLKFQVKLPQIKAYTADFWVRETMWVCRPLWKRNNMKKWTCDLKDMLFLLEDTFITAL